MQNVPFDLEDKREDWIRELKELIARAPSGLRAAMFVAQDDKADSVVLAGNFKSFKATQRFVKACLAQYDQGADRVKSFPGFRKGKPR